MAAEIKEVMHHTASASDTSEVLFIIARLSCHISDLVWGCSSCWRIVWSCCYPQRYPGVQIKWHLVISRGGCPSQRKSCGARGSDIGNQKFAIFIWNSASQTCAILIVTGRDAAIGDRCTVQMLLLLLLWASSRRYIGTRRLKSEGLKEKIGRCRSSF